MTLAELNSLDPSGFAAALDGVFEHSPWIVERAGAAGPFESIDELHRAMIAAIDRASEDEQLALLRAHPQLAGKAALSGTITPASANEQASAGLLSCTPDELARIGELNRRYSARFGFPFILAVRGLARQQILDEFSRRVVRERSVEIRECLAQVARIARFRLDALLAER